jgi:hypothetical protein
VATTNKEQVRGKKYRKFGRKSRPAKHHAGQQCGLRNCRKLLESRRYSTELHCYLA